MRRKNSWNNIGGARTLVSAVAVVFSIIMLLGTITPYYANSAQTQWSGVDATGAMVSEENSPIVVEKEVLTFDINEFPSNYYKDMTEYLAYSGKVTAEYTFYNPSDYTVTATLLFPYGKVPDYGERYDYNADEYVYNADADKYTVTIDGQEVETTIRHTFSYRYAQFKLQEDLPKVVDGYVKDDFYTPDTPVYCVTYSLSGITERAATAMMKWNADDTETKIMIENLSGGGVGEDYIQLELWANNNEPITVWLIGEYVDLPQWTIYKNGACEELADGKVELDSKTPMKTMTFKEFVMQDYNPESGILESDWYNAKVAELNENEWAYGAIRDDRGIGDFESSLLRWYEYEITLEPGQRIVNAVTAPMYPSIDLRYNPDIYNYTYLLSPATTWKEFGSLDIILNTPYYVTWSSVEGYEKTKNGYQWELSGLPEGELEFTLSTGENPMIPMTPYNIFNVIVNLLFNSAIVSLAIAIVIVFVIVGIVLIKWKKRRTTKDDN